MLLEDAKFLLDKDWHRHKIVHYSNIGGLWMLQGSDQHYPLSHVGAFAENLDARIRLYRPEVVILNGDHFNTPNGESAQKADADVLNYVARRNEVPIIFVPGNHCLRGTGDAAWSNFGALQKNIHAPLEDWMRPIVVEVKGKKILAGNIFYDDRFLDPMSFGFKPYEVEQRYAETLDGDALFGGSRRFFRDMADNFAAGLTPDIDVAVVHAVPHPRLINLRAAAHDEVTKSLSKKFDVRFVSNPEADRIMAAAEGLSERELRRQWNLRAFSNEGSNILNRKGFRPAHEGLHIISGHNHRSIQSEEGLRMRIGGRLMSFHGYQNPSWK